MSKDNAIKWYGYQRSNGSLQVKRYFGPDDISEARYSFFVDRVYGPWPVDGRESALEKLKEEIEKSIVV